MFKPANKSLREILLASALATASVTFGVLHASAEEQTTRVDLPAGALGDTLLELSNIYSINVVASERLVDGKVTQQISGEFDVTTALSVVLSGSGLSAFETSSGVYAIEKTEVPTPQPVSEPETSTPLDEAATEVEPDPLVVETIFVTGEGRLRTLQDTASSVVVLTEEDLRREAGPQTVRSILDNIPGVQLNIVGNGGPSIRGSDATGVLSGSGFFIGGSRERATLEIDGREATLPEVTYSSTGTWDVKQVEVFRGPQTSNRGRNSVAGTIVIETNDPTQEFEVGARAIAGNFETRDYAGYISGPIIEDQLAFRIAAERYEHRSPLELVLPLAGGDANNPFGGFDEDPLNEETTNVRAKFLLTPEAFSGLEMQATYIKFDGRRAQTENVDNARDGSFLRDNVNFPIFENEVESITLETNYRFSDSLGFRNTTTYAENVTGRRQPTGDPGFSDTSQLINKLYVDFGKNDDRISGLIGFYGQRSWQDVDLGLIKFDGSATSIGVFGEVDIGLSEKLTLTTGARYQYDEQDRFSDLSFLGILLDYEDKSEAFLPKATLTYDVNQENSIGAMISRGYNPGGVSIGENTFTIAEFDEEYLVNYELFWRGVLMDGRLTTNANVFFTDFESPQRGTTTEVDLGFTIIEEFTPVNGEDATSYGAEFSAAYVANDMLELSTGVSLLETEIGDVPRSVVIDAGNEFARAPNISANIGALITPTQNLSISLSGRYNGGYFNNDANEVKIPDFFVVDGQVAYEYNNARFFAFVRNALDERYATGLNLTFAGGQLGDPREYGVGVEVHF